MSTATLQTIPTGTWKVDPVHSHVGFAVKHMVVSTFRGQFGRYDGRLGAGPDGVPHLEGWVDAGSIEVRDENLAAHLASGEFFDTQRHPRIDFTSTAVRAGEGGELEVDGELTIKGHTGPVHATGHLSGPHVDIAGKEKVGAELRATIDRREFDLRWNAQLPGGGFALDNDVTLEVSLELVRED
jgi:polyisoprenoid-binding protein YceI